MTSGNSVTSPSTGAGVGWGSFPEEDQGVVTEEWRKFAGKASAADPVTTPFSNPLSSSFIMQDSSELLEHLLCIF